MRKSTRDRRHNQDTVTVKELEEELEDLRTAIKTEINNEVKSHIENSLKAYRVAVVAFAAGFALFLTVGLITKGQLFESMVKAIYPPENIHKDLKPQLLNTVWSTVTSGTIQDYEKFISRNEFYEALRTYHTDLVRTFLLPTRERAVRAYEILQVGKTPLEAKVLMAGKQYNGQPTARCFKEFTDAMSQAILVIPKNSDPADIEQVRIEKKLYTLP